MSFKMDLGNSEQFESGNQFPKLELKKDEVARIVLLSKKEWEVGLVHFVSKMGSVHCHAQMKDYSDLLSVEKDLGRPRECMLCAASVEDSKMVGTPNRKYAVKVLRYKTDLKGGKPAAGGLQYWMEIWLLGPKKFRQITEKQKEWGDLAQHDLMLTCTEQKYQNFDIDIKKDAWWVEKKDEVIAYWKSESPKYSLSECLGQTIDKETLERRFSAIRRRMAMAGDKPDLSGEDVIPPTQDKPSSKPSSAAPVGEFDNLFENTAQPKPEVPAVDKGAKKEAKSTDFLDDLVGDI